MKAKFNNSFNRIGFKQGVQLKHAIIKNITIQEQILRTKNINLEQIPLFIQKYADLSSASSLQLMEGMSKGSGISLNSIMCFNALQEILSPEGCTTFAAIGKATTNGNAFLLKNRDKSGNQNFDNSEHYGNKEINVVQSIKVNNENTIVGVSTAGSVGIFMGLNSYGVAAAINFGQATEIRDLSPKELYGISGRPQMLREGLEFSSAKDAVNHTLSRLINSPMGTPGILFFIDANNIFVIEGSSANNQFAVQHITDGATVRSNHFLLLSQLNDEKKISPICRKIRAQELLDKNFGKIDRDKLVEFSTDHQNGHFDNSICRHSKNLEESATVSAAIMEINKENALKSRISIAIGSPCWAWSHHDGNLTLQMDENAESVQNHFLNGNTFKKYFKIEPFQG